MVTTLSSGDVEAVAKRTSDILQKRGLNCCLMGSAASALWGTTRTPNDIDMVVMTCVYSQERLKEFIIAADSTYYLVASTNWRNSYKVLWHRVQGRPGVVCKVDILVPPTLMIPMIPSNHIVWVRDVPIMPLLSLLLLKLKGWEDHRTATSRRPDLIAKQHVDVKDIAELLAIAAQRGVRRTDDQWLCLSFRSTSKRRIRTFVQMHPGTLQAWQELGLSPVGPESV
ncbi:hypothetical protein BV25DRAFT_1826943 [Artomyces pyxidatus]|uniref:Uncharacterized protein n=1 Tax=Artomyces pyxidatus TaxID=48021 RepID=A0ACB8SX75_9AGAM|nr:hypothetical protein BV25DRAFT_1826943 [Artomyces pyxidatus]